jgi:amino acid transporter
MTSHKQADGDGGDEQVRTEAARQQDNDTLAKSYRYLRLAMVGLLLCLAAAVSYQSWRQGHLLGSVSAYYYTPAQAFFVAGLVGLGACMIALKGTTPVEDIFLDLGGVFAAVVALVPTGRDADYRAAVRACKEAGTPLLTQQALTGQLDCPTVQALEATAKANVDNNLAAFLFVGAIVLIATFVMARKAGPLKPQADGDAVKRRPGEVTKQSVDAVGDTVRELTAVRRDWYLWARVTLAAAAVTLVLWWIFHLISLFWVEAAVFVFFMVFWTVQTFELERSAKADGEQRAFPPSKTDFVWGFGAAVALWLVVLIARWRYPQAVIDNAHWIAAVFLFVCVLFVVWQSSRRAKSKQPAAVRSPN